MPCYLVVDPEERDATLLRLEGESYGEAPANTPIELHPGCVLQLDLPAPFA